MYSWVTLLYSRNEHNIVNQLYFSVRFLKNKKKKWAKEFNSSKNNYTETANTHEKMLNIISHQGSASQNYSEIPLYIH